MGCTSTVMVETRRVVPLPPETINSYIDKFPAIVLLKIKEKFDGLSQNVEKQINFTAFAKLFATAGVNEERSRKLFFFFTDNQNSNLKFRQFIVKYATIIKCDSSVLHNILFEIYKGSLDREHMISDQFSTFIKNEKEYFDDIPKSPQFPLKLQTFLDIMIENNFKVGEYQLKLMITKQEDIPFKQISDELAEADCNDFQPGKQYYIISNAWYQRSFYFQGVDHTLERQHIKSTKLLPEAKRIKRKHSSITEKKLSDSMKTNQLSNTLVEQPKSIDFEDIEGEYRGQLKESLKISAQIKVVTANLWKLLCLLHSSEQSFKRKAISSDSLEYYPKAIYYCQLDKNFNVILESQEIKMVSGSQKASFFISDKSHSNYIVYSKNFGEKNWREIQPTQNIAQISLDPRFFIAISKQQKKNYRKEVTKQNFDLGDKVFVHFAYIKVHAQAFIIGICKSDCFKIHYKGYSYRYEAQIKREDLSVIESQAALTSAKKRNQSLIKGIINVGNTCFINSIIQCLITTPVLQAFLTKYSFSQKKEPVGYGLSQIARQLLANQKPSAQQFKKMIDVQMPLFSGYDQHDAQQFLNLLLDRLNEEIVDKPTVIDYLFSGKISSKLTCNSCKNLKYIQEKMYILSLPIPEPEYNYFSIIVVPITSKNLKKFIFKLNKNATISDYCNAFEQRAGDKKNNYLFVQTSFNTLRKFKQQLMQPGFQTKLMTQIGIVPNISLLAFEKIPLRFYNDLILKVKAGYYDFQYIWGYGSQAPWTVCKKTSQKSQKGEIIIEYLTTDNELEKAKISKETFAELSAPLTSKTSDFSYKKIIFRKYNSILKRMENFGLQLLVGIPKWASYNDMVSIVERAIANMKQQEAKHLNIDDKGKGDYLIRFLDTVKLKCIFCLQQIPSTSVQQKMLEHCCNQFEREVPHLWVSKNKNFWIYIDWIDISKCKSAFFSSIDLDSTSRSVEISRQEQHINLQACMNLHSKPQVVEMQCDKCKEKYQQLQHLIGIMPNILVLHMKQFRYTAQGYLIKLDLRLKWQELLDSSKYTSTASTGKLYQLFALVRHSGTGQSGHYTSMVKRKHPFQNRRVWVNFDDDITTIVQQEEPFIDDAYLLFYKKVDMPSSALVLYS